jgi:CubicO group peptidase (beta-lactamase class C family)
MPPMPELVPLPPQPPDVPWPTAEWPECDLPASIRDALTALLDKTFSEPQPETTVQTDDLLVVHRGRIVAERYAPGFGRDDTQPSWSAAKSILQAAVGILVRDGKLDISQPADVPEWQQPGDSRAEITLDQLLHMTPGLRFTEDYVDDRISDVIKMLFRPGYDDMAAFAASFPQDHPPDTVSNYSSGTSNIISAIVKRIVGPGDEYLAFLRRELFDPIGMTSADPKFDKSGTWIGSSYCFATPRDFARFGLLYLRDGVWEGRRILPEGWVDYARTPAPVEPADELDRGYGAHWWTLRGDKHGAFLASGYVGQMIMVAPGLDLIIVRNGNTPAARRMHVRQLARDIIALFAGA